MPYSSHNSLKLVTLLLFSLFFITQVNAAVPNYSLQLDPGCKVKNGFEAKEKAVERYLTGNWVTSQLEKTSNPKKVIELTYDYQNFLNKSKPDPAKLAEFQKQQENETVNNLKTNLLTSIIKDYVEVVNGIPKPERNNTLTILVQCDRLLPTSSPGVKSNKVYEIKKVRPYNAPLELADLRLTQGMNTLVVLEYFSNKPESKLRVINSGLSELKNFAVKIDEKEQLQATIQANNEKNNIIDQVTNGKKLETTEFSGLNTYSTKLLGKSILLK